MNQKIGMLFRVLIIAAFINNLIACKVDKSITTPEYKTQKVIVIIIDGPRHSETWSDSGRVNIPFQNKIAEQSVLFKSFYNSGVTNTVNGHTAVTTGYNVAIDNGGNQLPPNESWFQLYRKINRVDSTKTWVVTSKDKLAVLGNCSATSFHNRYLPSISCGINGLASGARHDSLTLLKSLEILTAHTPDLMLIQFKEPDVSAHAGDWQAYLNGIRQTDEYVNTIFNFINKSAEYKNKTALFVTNDHGRHLDNVYDGFVSHGCNCQGCSHISLLAYGPDFKPGTVVEKPYALVDLAVTISHLLNTEIVSGDGKVIRELTDF